MNYVIQALTYFRILSGPILFIFIAVFSFYGYALVLFMLASSSDYFDGYLARKYKMESLHGAVLDPIADKIFTLFIILSLALSLESLFIAFIGGLILAREFWVAGLREYNSIQDNASATKVTFLGKLKTSIQFFAFASFLGGLYFENAFVIFISNFFLVFALILTLKSGLEYTVQTYKTSLNIHKSD